MPQLAKCRTRKGMSAMADGELSLGVCPHGHLNRVSASLYVRHLMQLLCLSNVNNVEEINSRGCLIESASRSHGDGCRMRQSV